MGVLIIRRIGMSVPLMFGVLLLTFSLINLAPGDPIHIIAGDEVLSEQYERELRARFGLEQPFWRRFLTYASEVVRGNLGYSMYSQAPVVDLFLSRLGPTMLLMLPQFVLSAILGVLLGVVSAVRQGGWQDSVATVLSLLAYSLPIFWLGQLCVGLFAIRLGWFPTGGMYSLREQYEGVHRVLDIARHLVLPTAVLMLSNLALVTRLTRASLLEVLRLDYVRTARSKGASESVVVYKHALRNGILPVVTALGLSFGFILSGTVLTETVFSWPGVGRLIFQAVTQRDTPLMLGLLLISSAAVILANLITDVLYAIIDPRIRYA